MKKFQPTTIISIVAVLAIAFLFNTQVFSQKDCNFKPYHQADSWVLGTSTIINFVNGEAIPSVSSTNISFPSGLSAISNTDGELKLVSDGLTVRNANLNNISNGGGLKGNNLATQSSILVPQPGSTSRYLLFTVDMYIPPVFTSGVNYTVVDFNSGIPSIISKNNLLFEENAQKISAVQHANGTDFWVVLHGYGNNKGTNFYSYLVTSEGVSTTPVTTSIGHEQNGDFASNNGAGAMKISPDGSKLALAIPDDGIVELYDFDTETGKVGNLKSSAASEFIMAFGIEFSPDNSKLYFTITPKDEITNYIYQLDLTQPNPFANPYIVHQFNVSQTGGSADSLLGALQLASNGRIYASKFKKGVIEKKHLGVIFNPNRPGPACNYNELNHNLDAGLYLGNGSSLMGLPNFVSTFLDIPHFYYENQCLNDTVKFTVRNKANIDNLDWHFFGNPAGTLVDNTPTAPKYIFSEAGDYTINMSEIYGAEQYDYTRDITIHPLPNVVLADGAETIYILENSSIIIDAGEWDTYEWQPGGSTERYLDVLVEGVYSVTVTNENCCKNTAQVEVKYATINFPTAFNPNSSTEINKEFKIVGKFEDFKSYKMDIFNKWGQLIFESEDSNEGWDGTYKGEIMPMGTYVYSAYFESYESSSKPSIEITRKGTFTLIR
jgi:gliding motility-associated-like protein